MTTPTVALLSATCRYEQGERRVDALRQVDLVVDSGELVAVMGPSASGKSTLVQAICGIVPILSGDLRIEGTSVRLQTTAWWATARRRVMGVVLQRLNLIETIDVLGNVTLPLVLDRAKRDAAERAGRDALEQVGLGGDVVTARPADLSGGEQQRVAIARAIVGKRRIILADEPTAALDTVTADSIVELLGSLATDGRAVLLTTHDTRLAGWADRVVTLRDGQVVGGATNGAEASPGHVMSPVEQPGAGVVRLRPIVHIAVADARSRRLRTFLVAALLVIVAIAPWWLTSLGLPAVVLAAAVAMAIAAVVIDANEGALRVLDLTGASRVSRLVLAASAVLVPAALAFVPALVGAIVVADEAGRGASMAEVVLGTAALVVVLPVLTALALGIVSALDAGGRPLGRFRWARVGVLVVLVPIVPVGTALAAGLLWVSRRHRRPTRWGLGLAVFCVVFVALALGAQSSWFNANFLAIVLLPVLAASVARVATGVLDGVARVVGDRRPLARLATEPLLARRTSYAPLAAIAALVLTAVTIQAVLGASLGERESRRQAVLARYDDRVGLNDHQLVAKASLPGDARGRLVAAAERQWGDGSVAVVRTSGFEEGTLDILGTIPDGGALARTRGAMRGPRDLALVEPDDLGALGLGSFADDLREGRALVLNPAVGDGTVVRVAHGSSDGVAQAIEVPGVPVSEVRIANDLPAVLVTPDIVSAATTRRPVADLGLSPDTSLSEDAVDRSIIVVDLGREPTASDVETFRRMAKTASPRKDPVEEMRRARQTGTTLNAEEIWNLYAGQEAPTVRSGAEAVHSENTDRPLNEAAFAGARTWEASRGSLALGAAVALLIVVIVALLANGLSRADDEIIELQGGSPHTRRRLAAIQAGVMGAAATLVAIVVGVGAVGLGVAFYNGQTRWSALGFQDPRPLPAIPFTVPWPVLATLVVVPVLAAAVSAVMTSAATRSEQRTLASRLA